VIVPASSERHRCRGTVGPPIVPGTAPPRPLRRGDHRGLEQGWCRVECDDARRVSGPRPRRRYAWR